MRLKSIFVFVILFAIFVNVSVFSTDAYGQHGGIAISGQVLDANGQPVMGAGVLVKGTDKGVITDVNGNYAIQVPSKGSVIAFSSLGYQPKEITVEHSGVYNITLNDDTETLESVVVVAYGAQKKATITGALSSVKSDQLVSAPVADITNVLAGKLPGVTTVQTSGQPGDDFAQIFIRGVSSLSTGASQPLILVDGVERPMNSIDPNEIESLSILKDASSTAVFGIRGANGVILVTTKRGGVGKPQISISSTHGFQQPMSYVEQTGSYEFARYWNLKQKNDGVTNPASYFSREALEAFRTGSNPMIYPNVNWSDLIYKKAFYQTKNNINISGGSENVRYFVSMGFYFQDGLLKKTDILDHDENFKYNRYNFRSNLDFRLSPSTFMKFNIAGVVGQKQEPRVIEDISNAWVYTRIWVLPFTSPGLIDGVRTILPRSFFPSNSVRDGYSGFFGYGCNQTISSSLNIDLELTQHLDFITEGLSASIKGSFDTKMYVYKIRKGNGLPQRTIYYKTYYENPSIPITDPDYDKSIVYSSASAVAPLSYSESTSSDRNWYLEARLDYARTFNKHSVTGLLLYNQSRDYYPAIYSYLPRGYVGVVGRVTYSYDDKYLFDFNAGYNGSENFAPGKNRYGFFPSFSAGYVISKENFMKNQNVFDFLKIRASVGKVGNDQGTTSRFMYMNSVWNQAGSYSFGTTADSSIPYYTSSTPGNKQVTWETAMKYNVGLDTEFLSKRLSFSGDVFYEYRTGILLTPNSVPSVIATTLPEMNIGEVSNRGYEIDVAWKDATSSGFSYGIDFNVSYAKNRIEYMDEVLSNLSYQNQTGGSTGRFSGLYKFERLYNYSDFYTDANGKYVLNPELPQPSTNVYPGDAMYADLNKDGIIDSKDTMVYGYSTRPEYMFGSNWKFGWKGFSLEFNWIAATHVNKMMYEDYRIPFTNAGNRGLLTYFYEDGWTIENPNGTLPRAAETSENWNSFNSTLWLRDSSYIRLKSASFGYSFGKNRTLQKIGMKNLTLMFTGYNLLTFSPLKYEDPESTSDNLGEYPLVKSYNFSLNLNF